MVLKQQTFIQKTSLAALLNAFKDFNIRYDISCESSVGVFEIFEKASNLKLSSAENCRWHFMG